jgi:hypothetical protein
LTVVTCEELIAAAAGEVLKPFSVMPLPKHARFVRNCDSLTMEGERMSTKQIVQGSDAGSPVGSAAIADIKACTRARSAPKEEVLS